MIFKSFSTYIELNSVERQDILGSNNKLYSFLQIITNLIKRKKYNSLNIKYLVFVEYSIKYRFELNIGC